ncbi:MAG: hypothetical protein KGN02_12665 [bacterium]|nr:hypothetical protein [bacterium]
MGIITRTAAAWLLVVLAFFPIVTSANDAGPGREVGAIRHDLPTLVAADASGRIVVDAVAVDGDDALAQWHDDRHTVISYLTRRLRRWWLAFGEVSSTAVPSALRARAVGVLPAFPAWLQLHAPATCPPGEMCSIDDGIPEQDDLPLREPIYTQWNTQGYVVRMQLARNDALPGSSLRSFIGRAPTEAESWLAQNGNSYFFFSATVHATATTHVAAGSTIDVRFPFALDPSLRYSLSLAILRTATSPDIALGPIDATLHANALHVVLPAFDLAPGAELHGEIEGD